jgi:hypothetical protein
MMAVCEWSALLSCEESRYDPTPATPPPVPAATKAAVQAAFPRGSLAVEFRAEFDTLYDDQLFADLYPP